MAVIRTGEKLVRVQLYLELEDIKTIKHFAEVNKMTFSAQARKFMEPSIKWHLQKEEKQKQKEIEKNKEESEPISDFSSGGIELDFSSGPKIDFEKE